MSNGNVIITNLFILFLFTLILFFRTHIPHFFIRLMVIIQIRVNNLSVVGLFVFAILSLNFSLFMMNFNITLLFRGEIVIIENVIKKFVNDKSINGVTITSDRFVTRVSCNLWFISEFRWFTNWNKCGFNQWFIKC